jgi:hypothetical protein
VGYGANGPSDCLGGAQNVYGSWTITLTSIAPTPDAGGYFTPHGTLSATLLDDSDAGRAPATLSVSF